MILKDDDVSFKKITASYIWGNSSVVKNVGFYTTCCRRRMALLGNNGLMKSFCIYFSGFDNAPLETNYACLSWAMLGREFYHET